MIKTISDSRREIGIFRAIGFTRVNIISIYSLQGVLYTALGGISGLILGVVLNWLLAGLILGEFNNLVSKTISQTYGITPEVVLSQFQTFAFKEVGILLGILFILAMVVSVIFSIRGSAISPVEAIKN